MADQPRMQLSEERLRIKPPLTSNNKEVAALKAELEIELKNKKQCAYQPFECTQLTLDGYKYCAKHILQDKIAPFKQCSFVYSNNGKRCHLPAPKTDKKDTGFCTDHSIKTVLARNRQNSKCPPPQTAEVLLCSLSPYVKKARNKSLGPNCEEIGEKIVGNEGGIEQKSPNVDPFQDIDANRLYNSACKDVLDLCSESDSDIEASTFASVWHDSHADSSDDESIDSEQEDVLKHANVYTAEEITSITREKLIKLQSLYIEQYRHLQHCLKERKRKYLQSLKREKETCCNVYNQIRENPKEQRLYKKLKAYNKYHRTNGEEAVLNKRQHDLRAKITEGIPSKPHSYTKCMFTEGGVKCGERTLPLAKHCRKHILEDQNQVLFKMCGKINGDVECTTPIEVVFEEAVCRLHMEMPEIKSYSQLRKNSESDFDDSLDNTPEMPILPLAALNDSQSNLATNEVKTELIDFKEEDLSVTKTVPNDLFEERITVKSEIKQEEAKECDVFMDNVKDDSMEISEKEDRQDCSKNGEETEDNYKSDGKLVEIQEEISTEMPESSL